MKVNLSSVKDGVLRFVKANDTKILLGLAVSGTIGASIVSFRTGMQVNDRIASRQEDYSKTEYVKNHWKDFVPMSLALGGSVGTIFALSSSLSAKQKAAYTAYALTKTAFDEYKTSVTELLGPKKDQTITDKTAERNVSKTENSLVILEANNVLCFDMITGRYFESTVEKIRKAENDINHQINIFMSASLSDFYEKIGLPRTEWSSRVGWNVDQPLNINFSTIMSENETPCVAISYSTDPVTGYYRLS